MKYWEATMSNIIVISPTLKGLAAKLGVKPSQIEGVYYRKRLNDLIKIKKVVVENPKSIFQVDVSGNFIVRFDQMENETAAERYRKTDKCKDARKRYYDTKGKVTSHIYYLKNREKIIERSKARYDATKNDLSSDLSGNNP